MLVGIGLLQWGLTAGKREELDPAYSTGKCEFRAREQGGGQHVSTSGRGAGGVRAAK